ncbi:Apoptotic chromatin condensation inducer in the nucleus [Actinomortierella ambigua]|nr:Apoptotic chromatin condensation inducer in the nucleus [Actinomortierella ambigua]
MDPNSLKVTELRNELSARGLSTKGVKKDLVARLEEALANETSGSPMDKSTGKDNESKDSPMDQDNEQDQDQDQEPTTTDATAESNDIAKIAPPTTVSDDNQASSVSAPVPIPASAPDTTLSALEPVVGTPSLMQEGLVDTTATAASVTAEGASASTRMESVETMTTASSRGRKRSKPYQAENEEESNQQGEENAKDRGGEEEDKDSEDRSSKKARHDTSGSTLMPSAPADMDRRSDAPSPSPLQTTAPTLSPAQNNGGEQTSSPVAGGTKTSSPEDERKGGARRIDARSLMERQVQQAVKDRVPDLAKASSTDVPDTASVCERKDEAEGKEAPAAGQDRALAIINFVRPLTLPQVKRMLSEFGEIEHFWMDSIKTHCYVTYKTVEMAQKAYDGIKGVVFPKETGKALEPHFISAEDALWSSEEAEKAQNNRQRPTIFMGGASEKRKMEEAKAKTAKARREEEKKAGEALTTTESAEAAATGAAAAAGKEDAATHKTKEERLAANTATPARRVIQAQVVQPDELFQRTTTLPVLYFKALVDPPVKPSPAINA